MKLNKEEIFSEVKKVISDLFEIDEKDIKLDSHLYHDLDLDSIDAINMMGNLKKITNKRIDPVEFITVRTVDDLVVKLQNLLSDERQQPLSGD